MLGGFTWPPCSRAAQSTTMPEDPLFLPSVSPTPIQAPGFGTLPDDYQLPPPAFPTVHDDPLFLPSVSPTLENPSWPGLEATTVTITSYRTIFETITASAPMVGSTSSRAASATATSQPDSSEEGFNYVPIAAVFSVFAAVLLPFAIVFLHKRWKKQGQDTTKKAPRHSWTHRSWFGRSQPREETKCGLHEFLNAISIRGSSLRTFSYWERADMLPAMNSTDSNISHEPLEGHGRARQVQRADTAFPPDRRRSSAALSEPPDLEPGNNEIAWDEIPWPSESERTSVISTNSGVSGYYADSRIRAAILSRRTPAV
jgi:hypothetical protein